MDRNKTLKSNGGKTNSHFIDELDYILKIHTPEQIEQLKNIWKEAVPIYHGKTYAVGAFGYIAGIDPYKETDFENFVVKHLKKELNDCLNDDKNYIPVEFIVENSQSEIVKK